MPIPRKGDVWVVSPPGARPFTGTIAAIAWLQVNGDWAGDDRPNPAYLRPCVVWEGRHAGAQAMPLRVKQLARYGTLVKRARGGVPR